MPSAASTTFGSSTLPLANGHGSPAQSWPVKRGTDGNQGQGAAGNTPGGREYPSPWVDASGNLWLFGGVDQGDTEFNDMWEFSGGTTGTWAWMNGSSSAETLPGTYGTEGQGTTLATPGSREESSSWTDTSGNLLALRRRRHPPTLLPRRLPERYVEVFTPDPAKTRVYSELGHPPLTRVPISLRGCPRVEFGVHHIEVGTPLLAAFC